MNIKTITPRKPLTSKNLRENISIFIKETSLHTQYLTVQFNIFTKVNKNKHTLCNKVVIDLQSKIGVKTFKDIIMQNYLKLCNNKGFLKTAYITIHYLYSNEDEYKNFINNLKTSNKLKFFDDADF
uniref:hypothetical protein n=1 Tax=Porodaedalea mongolica TaxID=2651638 RepID=UPI0021AC79E2|nr:hypothetical protein NYK79_mgp09 [Porodaedalea mongolica]UUA03981.1 hypothetical protein [Porodaedalea mongolica]WCF76750.1 hypothetical protein [Porodaedalea mongolica]